MVLSEIMPFVRVKSRRNNGCPSIAPTFTNYDFIHLGTMLNSVANFAGVSLSTACRIVAYIAAIARLTFAVWKHRFPIISLTMKLSLEDITKVIIATAALHNICRNYSIEEVAPEVDLPRESVFTVTSENLENIVTHRQEIISNYF